MKLVVKHLDPGEELEYPRLLGATHELRALVAALAPLVFSVVPGILVDSVCRSPGYLCSFLGLMSALTIAPAWVSMPYLYQILRGADDGISAFVIFAATYAFWSFLVYFGIGTAESMSKRIRDRVRNLTEQKSSV